MYLLDTVVLSELRKRRRDGNVVAWIGAVPSSDLYVSVLTLGEIELGIERQRAVNPDFAEELVRWLDMTLGVYADRILPVTLAIARRWGRLAAQLGNRDLDLAIAATAIEHGLTVVTRNVSHFERTGALIMDPFSPQPRRKP
jgi:predicted nucleic acid-binding protein